MPKFDSPLGSKKIPGNQMREFDIPDETEMTPVMRQRGPSLHGPQPPVDINEAMAFRQRMMDSMAEEPDDSADFEKEVRAAREAKRTGVTRLNEGAKRRIEMLVGMTRTIREVDVDGNKFVFQTLRSKEMREAIMAAAEFDNTVQSPFETRRQLLARSLVQVASVDVAQFVGSDSLEAKLLLIDDLDESLLDRLFTEYLTLAAESRSKFAIKNAEDVKGLAEDLKK